MKSTLRRTCVTVVKASYSHLPSVSTAPVFRKGQLAALQSVQRLMKVQGHVMEFSAQFLTDCPGLNKLKRKND